MKDDSVKRVCVFLFSGTGMTRYVVRRLSKELEKQQAAVDVFEIEERPARNISFLEYDVVGVAYPVHSFNAPKIVIDFAKGLPETERKGAFVISTAGGDSPVNCASSDLLTGILRKRGFNVFLEKQFIMPSNFIARDDDKAVDEKLDSVKKEIPAVADGILNNICVMRKAGFFAGFIALIGRVEWLGMRLVRLYSTNECDRCGLCAAKCPNRNISVEEGGAVFKWRCGLCMRCVYLCPKRAVRIRFPVKFFAFDRWYDNEELSIIENKTES